MKKILKTFLLLFLIYGCSSSSGDNDTMLKEPSSTASKITNNNYSYKASRGSEILEAIVSKEGSVIQNDFKYYDSITNEIFVQVSYTFNPSVDGWKYDEQQKVLDLANEIKDKNLTIVQLEGLNYILDNIDYQVLEDVDDNNFELDLFSPIYCIKSAVLANLRAVENSSSTITGTMMPTFLTGRTMFLFQEDIYLDTAILKANIGSIQNIDSSYEGDIKLVNKILTTNKPFLRYDEIYELYIPKDEFNNIVNNIQPFNKEDCDYDNCKIGCGSDWGCCGNYGGCCYYSHKLCYLHDLICTACAYKDFCLPGCKPDKPGNLEVKYYGLSRH